MAAGKDEAGKASSGVRKLEFGSDVSFQTELNRRVEEYFAGDGGRRKRDCWEVYLKTFCILLAFAVVYGLLVFAATELWQGLVLATVLGLVVAAIGFNIQHEGGHQGYSERRWVNRLAAFTMDMIGSSSYRWHWKHAVIHHRYVNITGYDGDMYMGPLGRLALHQRRHWFHRWQHLYLWALYALLAVKMQFADDIRFLMTGRLEGHTVPPAPRAAPWWCYCWVASSSSPGPSPFHCCFIRF
jgi:linoleoyl-CoA desaturase